ncbi:MAG: hypothetical protein A2Z21_07220 [Candidatus Fraserbacteria bacterium RBG_16_55_9]|uniref:DUF5050 domain-containing protein n=1 Tax=Fraserbacteria sp. (strain RBG_16_55_9) TaxID=1817864 RepID=A0A1F5USL5_FRAXR|nr:MAG: hypothetical protein A2Z21_07220 [Candidatus Fraserbacteria bacterium RBG_16_55_9]
MQIALDLAQGKLYWAESFGGKIRRANLNGTDVEDILTGLDGPAGLELDLAAGMVYWTEHPSGKIRRCN